MLLLALGLLRPALLALFALLLAALLVPVRSFRLRHIPGPPRLPVLGNMLEILRMGSSVFYTRTAAQYGPVFKCWFGRLPYVVVTDPQVMQALAHVEVRAHLGHILSTADAELEVFGLTGARGAIWRTTRTAWQPAFHPASLAAYFGLMDQAAGKLVAHLSGLVDIGAPVNILSQLRSMTLAVNGSIAYGVDFSTLKDTLGAAGDGTGSPFYHSSQPGESWQAAPPTGYGARLLKACQVLLANGRLHHTSFWFKVNYMLPELNRLTSCLAYLWPDRVFSANLKARAVIKATSLDLLRASAAGDAAAAEPSYEGKQRAVGIAADSFLGMLLSNRTRSLVDVLSDAQVLAQAMTFVLAGFETTANALAFTIHSIAANPEVQARVLAEVDAFGRDRAVDSDDLGDQFSYLAAVLQESLRMYPPAPAVKRVSPTAMDLGGYRVPAGTAILLSIYALHRDPTVWPEPDRFLPERFMEPEGMYHALVPGAHLPFGLGRRMCIGHRFAVREAVLTLVRLYQRYVFVLQPGQVPLALVNGINCDSTLTLAPKHGIYVTIERR